MILVDSRGLVDTSRVDVLKGSRFESGHGFDVRWHDFHLNVPLSTQVLVLYPIVLSQDMCHFF